MIVLSENENRACPVKESQVEVTKLRNLLTLQWEYD